MVKATNGSFNDSTSLYIIGGDAGYRDVMEAIQGVGFTSTIEQINSPYMSAGRLRHGRS